MDFLGLDFAVGGYILDKAMLCDANVIALQEVTERTVAYPHRLERSGDRAAAS